MAEDRQLCIGGTQLRKGGLDAIRDCTRTNSVWINTSDAPMAEPFVMR